MEYLGHTQTATYMTGPKVGGTGAPTFLPSISTMQSSYKPYDTYPAPSPLRRSLTTLPWRPSTYYSTARVDHSLPVSASMPDPASDRNRLTELDSIKVSVGGGGILSVSFTFIVLIFYEIKRDHFKV